MRNKQDSQDCRALTAAHKTHTKHANILNTMKN